LHLVPLQLDRGSSARSNGPEPGRAFDMRLQARKWAHLVHESKWEHSSERIRCFLIRFGDEVRIDVEGRNITRRHGALNYLTPIEFEDLHLTHIHQAALS
jgi:hypothetical protein